MSEIFQAGMEIPQDIDGLSAAPKGYKEYQDNTKNGTEWMKTIIQANYPAITGMQVFHESKSDMGGKMLVRFMYNGKNMELPVTYDRRISTLTPTEFSSLAPHIQSMNPETRGLFNVILQEIGKKEAINKKTKIALSELEDTARTA